MEKYRAQSGQDSCGSEKEMKLTPKQNKFCLEFLVDMNATQAAIRAGYSRRTANPQAARLLVNVSVQEHIRRLRDIQTQRVNITADYVLNSLKTVADRCLQAEPVLDNEGEPTGEYRFNAAGACKALELLGKHLGLFDTPEAAIDDTPKAVRLPFIPGKSG